MVIDDATDAGYVGSIVACAEVAQPVLVRHRVVVEEGDDVPPSHRDADVARDREIALWADTGTDGIAVGGKQFVSSVGRRPVYRNDLEVMGSQIAQRFERRLETGGAVVGANHDRESHAVSSCAVAPAALISILRQSPPIRALVLYFRESQKSQTLPDFRDFESRCRSLPA